MIAKFILSKKVLKEQIKKLEELGIKISYSYKTNRIVGDILQEIEEGKNIFDWNNHRKIALYFAEKHKITIEETDADILFIE